MQRLVYIAARCLFVVNLVITSVAFVLFINWYDTGQWDADGWQAMATGAVILGCFALFIEEWLYRKYRFWPSNLVLFILRSIFLNTVYIILSFAVGSAASMYRVPKDSYLVVLVQQCLGAVVMIAFYWPIAAPFGIVAGLANGFLMRAWPIHPDAER